MEYKIGKIFEENGKWYQCLEGYECGDCSFNNSMKCDKLCVENERSDETPVIFKELEKIGEPYDYVVHNRGVVMLQPYKLFTTPFINGVVCNVHYDSNTIDIEIKQSKEDMEEKKQKLDKLVEDYSYNRIPYEVFDNCLKQLYVDKQIGENNPYLKEFDLEAAKSGKPVCTKNGKKARIICFDAKGVLPIIALVESGDEEKTVRYSNSGRFRFDGMPDEEDLIMASEKKEGWINVYRDCDGMNITKDDNIYSLKDAAIASAQIIDKDNYVTTVKIQWEE